ncbi:MAG: alpha-hydroxy acid oxidase, partial [Rhodospirillaceae bacterium]
LARKRLPDPLFHFMDGGAEDESSLRRNTTAFDKFTFAPSYLVDVSKVDTKTTLFGKTLDWPVILSPTGTTRLFHHEKELGVARAAAKMNTLYSVSTMATTSLEDIAAAAPDGLRMFQIYILKDRTLTAEFVERSKAANYDALCLTVDVPVGGNRERDKMTGMIVPPKFGLKSLLSFAMHPGWSLNFALHPAFQLANVVHKVDALKGDMNLMDYVNGQFDRTVTWDDAEWLAKQWNGPFVIKGLMSADDAKRARDIGATAVMVSNHGGRQMDATPGAVECIAP